MKILGVLGVAGSGKDAAADLLVRERKFVRVAMADPLKRLARDSFEFTDDQLWGPSSSRNAPDKRYPRPLHRWPPKCQNGGTCLCCGVEYSGRETPECYLTPRYCLQQLGSQWGRDCYPNVWAEYAVRTAQWLLDMGGRTYDAKRGRWPEPTLGWPMTHGGVAIPDVRFVNEADAIKAAGGKVVRIVRPGAGLKGSAGLHSSETEQLGIHDDAFDYVLQNDSTLAVLGERVSRMLDVFGWQG